MSETTTSDLLEFEHPMDEGSARTRGAVVRHQSVWPGVGKLFLFLGVLLAGIYSTDCLLTYGLRQVSTGEFGVMNRIVEGQIDTEILISGSSRALTHYDPRIIGRLTGRSSYNIGLNGSQTDMQLARLQVYLQHNRRPKLLVQNLDLFSFVTSHELYDPGQYVPYLNEAPIYAGVRRVYPEAWKWKYLPLYGYAVQDMRLDWLIGLRGLLDLSPREDQFDGYRPRKTPWTGDFEKFREANQAGVTVETEPQGLHDFEEILATCARMGIPAVVVYSPEYYEMQLLERNRAEILALAARLAERYGVPLWDYSQSPISRNRDNFYNSQHLNADGAASFSRDFGQRLAQEIPTLTDEKK